MVIGAPFAAKTDMNANTSIPKQTDTLTVRELTEKKMALEAELEKIKRQIREKLLEQNIRL